ncbi:MAG: biotin/lipoyl-binding protein [Casimicrobiaceae bacterium]
MQRVPCWRGGCQSGTLEPVHQTVVKSKVAADIVGLTVRDGEAVRAGQKIAHIESPDLQSPFVDRVGAVESVRAPALRHSRSAGRSLDYDARVEPIR